MQDAIGRRTARAVVVEARRLPLPSPSTPRRRPLPEPKPATSAAAPEPEPVAGPREVARGRRVRCEGGVCSVPTSSMRANGIGVDLSKPAAEATMKAAGHAG